MTTGTPASGLTRMDTFPDSPMEGGNMIDKSELCEKIRSIYPDTEN